MTDQPRPPDLGKEMERGQRAEELLNSPLLQETLLTLRSEFMEAWKGSPARDSEGREKIWHLYKLVDKFEAHLTTVLQTGMMAAEEVRQRSLLDRMKAGLGFSSE